MMGLVVGLIAIGALTILIISAETKSSPVYKTIDDKIEYTKLISTNSVTQSYRKGRAITTELISVFEVHWKDGRVTIEELGVKNGGRYQMMLNKRRE